MFSKDEIRKIANESRTRDELAKTIAKDVKGGAYNILDSCVLCRNYLTPSTYGAVLESVVKQKFNLHNAKNLSYGDANIHNTGIEIKTSLGHKSGKWGLRQIRFDAHIEQYLVLLYDNIKVMNHFLLIPRIKMQELVYEFGGYIHGTKKQHGKITRKLLNNTTNEFYLTFNKHAPKNSKDFEIWKVVKQHVKTIKALEKELHN